MMSLERERRKIFPPIIVLASRDKMGPTMSFGPGINVLAHEIGQGQRPMIKCKSRGKDDHMITKHSLIQSLWLKSFEYFFKDCFLLINRAM